METPMESTSCHAIKIKLFSGPGTRRWSRFEIAEVPSIKSVTSGTGSALKVINISRGGALLRTMRRLPPSTRIQINLALAGGVVQLTSYVLRSSLSSQNGLPRYQSAVAFDRPLRFLDGHQQPTFDIPQYPIFEPSSFDVCSFESMIPRHKPVQDRTSDVVAAFFALRACSQQDAALREMLNLNDW
jgi:hypothetical protein